MCRGPTHIIASPKTELALAAGERCILLSKRGTTNDAPPCGRKGLRMFLPSTICAWQLANKLPLRHHNIANKAISIFKIILYDILYVLIRQNNAADQRNSMAG